jgi:hypothetical protein
MSELLPRGLLRRLRLLAPLLAGAVSLYSLPIPCLAQSQTVPASLRACTAESDPTRRLACYDREMGRSSPAAAGEAVKPAPPARLAPPAAPAPDRAASALPPAPTGVTPSVSPAPPAVTEAPAPTTASRLKRIFASSGSWHETARIASLDRSPDAMVMHLDNGQVWQQVGRASGDLSLQAGDSVTIEKHLGSYWLSSRYVSNMKVRQQTPSPPQ